VSGALNDVTVGAPGSLRADGVTDAQGKARFGQVPAGRYTVTVGPPDGAAFASAGIYEGTLDVAAAGLTKDVTLPALVTLTGHVAPTGASAGMRITALDDGLFAPATAPSALVAGDGEYNLKLSPGRNYRLLLEPASGQELARGVVATLTPGPTPAPLELTAAAAVVLKGLFTAGGPPAGNVVVQAFCAAPAAPCVDPSVPVAQGTTNASGAINLIVPLFPAHP
jgi:hypothetical protein